MIIESVGVSLAAAKARGGKFTNLKDAEIKNWYLIVAAFILEYASVYFSEKGYTFISSYILYVHFISYLLLFAGLFFNRDKLSFKIIFIGTLLNFIVIMANGGQMPVSVNAMIKAGLENDLKAVMQGNIVTHTVMGANTAFKYLGDLIALPKPYPLPKVLSIGDFFIAAGAFIYIQEIMVRKIKNLKTNS